MTPALGVPKNAGQLHGRNVAKTAPTDGEGLVWDETSQSWQPGTVSSGGTFDVDMSGNLMPSETVNTDQYYEADGNNDLMPKVV